MSSSLQHFLSFPSAAQAPLTVTFVGAGNLAHVWGGQLGARADVRVNMMTRKAAEMAPLMTTTGIQVRRQSPKESVPDTFVTGKMHCVSSRAEDVIPEADIVIITAPSNAREEVMAQIAPHVNKTKRVLIGAVPGIGGFDWIARQYVRRYSLSNVVVFSIKDVPFMCSGTVFGKSSINLGPKKALFLAVNNLRDSVEMDATAHMLHELTDGIPVERMDSFMTSTLTPGNPIMHPSIMYGMFGPYSQWDGKPLPEPPLFYEEVNELSAFFLTKADAEVQSIKIAVSKKTGVDLTAVWPLRLNLKMVYGDLVADNRNLMLAMRTNRAYRMIRTPLKKEGGGFVPNVEHRFFLEDVPFGLVILRDVADMVGVQTPMIDELIEWAQGLMGKQYLVNGKLDGRDMYMSGAPSRFGIVDVQDLVFGHLKDLPQKARARV